MTTEYEPGYSFIEWFAPSLGLNPADIRRITIDADYRDATVVYVEMLSTKEGLLKLQKPSLSGAKVIIVGAQ